MRLTKSVLVLYLGVLVVLGYITYGGGLGFTFWKDDWFFLWSVLYQPGTVANIFLHPHPATGVVFFTLGKLFGEDVHLWLHAGILIRVMASVAVFLVAVRVTKSRLVGMLSGIFFVTSSIGLEAVSWPSAYVVNVVVVFLCLAIYFWISFLQKGKNVHFVVSILYLSLGIASDPWRALPIIVLVYLASIFFSLHKKRIMNYELRIMNKKVQIFCSLFTVVGLVLVSLAVWQRRMLVNSQMVIYLRSLRGDPGIILEKLYVVGKFFQSLSNLAFGWLFSASHEVSEVSHGVYVPSHVFLGVLTFVVAGVFIVYLWNKNGRVVLVLGYFVLWIVMFYFPSWFFEPRLIAAYPHRYLVLPSVGFIVLVAYGISQIRKRVLVIIIASLFVIMNIFKVHNTLEEMSVFRRYRVVESVWTTIDSEVSPESGPKVFIYTGADPVKVNILDLSGSSPFALKRKITKVEDFPVVTHDTGIIVNLLCNNGPLALGEVYAWEINNSGEFKSVSARERMRLREEVQIVGCRL